MPAYVIGQIEVTDVEKWERYKNLAAASVAKFHGRYLIRGGAIEHLEGRWDVPRLVMVEFPSMEEARRWFRSPEYAAAKAARGGGGTIRLSLVEGAG